MPSTIQPKEHTMKAGFLIRVDSATGLPDWPLITTDAYFTAATTEAVEPKVKVFADQLRLLLEKTAVPARAELYPASRAHAVHLDWTHASEAREGLPVLAYVARCLLGRALTGTIHDLSKLSARLYAAVDVESVSVADSWMIRTAPHDYIVEEAEEDMALISAFLAKAESGFEGLGDLPEDVTHFEGRRRQNVIRRE